MPAGTSRPAYVSMFTILDDLATYVHPVICGHPRVDNFVVHHYREHVEERRPRRPAAITDLGIGPGRYIHLQLKPSLVLLRDFGTPIDAGCSPVRVRESRCSDNRGRTAGSPTRSQTTVARHAPGGHERLSPVQELRSRRQ
jgi:hypothetical protein